MEKTCRYRTRLWIVWWESSTCPMATTTWSLSSLQRSIPFHTSAELPERAPRAAQGAEQGLYGAGQAGTLLSDVGRWVMAIHPSALLCLHTRCALKTCSGFIGWKTTGAPQTLQLKVLSCCTADQHWNPPAAPTKPLSLSLSLSLTNHLSLTFSLCFVFPLCWDEFHPLSAF